MDGEVQPIAASLMEKIIADISRPFLVSQRKLSTKKAQE
jgi:hypothetical protein